ncbi:hypothetical protein C9374_005652 [Naegleria lovaniensis]|uniref:HP domain-containing protein n=1 Tax=Naegleria lovaniensis TaxID=51637 RepID=A0AA88KJS7_NAELO|nr:uncharacterized protein C9374_005652 [Naegleria lovaniensis]KAG2381860.1 hypothetical protein C9374_005652 [Naegleria lovaniensis]
MSGDVKGTLSKVKSGNVSSRLAAIGALFSLASDDDIREEIREMGGIGILVGCLDESADPRIPRQACGALLNMANDDKCREEIRDYGGIELILKLIENQFKDATSLEYATGALLNLSSDDETREMVREANGAPILAHCLKDAPSDEVLRNSVGSVASLCFDPEFTRQLVSEGALPHIINALESKDGETRSRTSGCIWNLSVTSDETREALAREGCLEKLVDLLKHHEENNEDPETVGNCVMCLSILSSNDLVSETLREMDGCFEMIVKFLTNSDATIAQNAAAAVWNLAHNDENKKVLAGLDTMAALIPLLDAFQSESQWDALEKVLGAVLTSSTHDTMADQFRENNGFPSLKSIIEGKVDPNSIQDDQHKKCVLYGIIGFAVLAYNDKNKDEIRECGALADLIELLRLEYDDDLLEKVTAALLNLTHNIENRVAIRKLDGIAPLIELLYHPNETISMNAAGCLWNLSNDESCKAVIRSLGGLKPLLTIIGGGKVAPKSKKDRAISKEAIEAANRLVGGADDEEPVPEEKFDVAEFIEEKFNPNKEYEKLDEQVDKPLKNQPQLNRNGEQRTTTGAGIEYGEETGMTPAKIIVGAARIDIKNRRRQAEIEREKKEAEERELRRKEAEERERARKKKEEEELRRKEEEQKKKQKEEEERKRKFEEEMKRKAEEEERQRLLAEAEQTKNQSKDAFDAKHKRKNVKDEDIDWDEIYEDGFTPSKTKEEARDKLQGQIDEYSNLIDPFNSNGVRDQLTEDDLKFIESEIERAKNFLEQNPNATKEQIDDARKELDANVKPLIERAKARKVLTDMTQNIRDRLMNDSELLNNLTPEERRELEQALAEMEEWLRDHPDATKEEIEAKERELLSKIKPILARAKTRNDLENYAHDLRKKASGEDEEMEFDLLGDEDKRNVHDAIREIEDYLLEHPHATAQDYEDKLQEAKKRVDPILKKARAKKELLEYASGMRDRLQNDPDLKKRITPEERRGMEQALDDFDKWIKNHPNADLESLEKQKQRLKQKLDPIVSRADAHNTLDEYINRTRKRIDDKDDLGDLLDDMDKKTLQKELKDSEDFLKKVEKEPSKYTADDISQKKKELKEKMAPLLEKANKRKDLKDYARRVRDVLASDHELAPFLSPKERKLIENETQDVEDWIRNSKKATPQQTEERRKKFEEKVKPVLDQAAQRKELSDYAQRIKDRLEDPQFVDKLKPEEKKALQDGHDELKNFLAKNPEATSKDIEKQRDKVNEKVLPILERVREQTALENHVNNVRDKVRDDPQLSKFLSDKEKKAIEKAVQDVEKTLKNKPSIAESKKAKDQFNDTVKPLIENAFARSKLSDHADEILKEVMEDPQTTSKDKEAVKKAKKDLIDDFLAKNPDATKDQVEQQRKKFDDAVSTVTDRIHKKKELERKLNDLQRKLDDPESAVCTKSTPEERQYLVSKLNEMNKFLDENPNATTKQLEDKLNEFTSQVEPTMKTCEKRAQLDQLANNIRDRLVDPNDDLCKYLNDKEKQQLRDATMEALNFLEKNPGCSGNDVTQAKKKLDDKTKELLERAKARGGLYRKAGGLISDASNYGEGGLGGKLNSVERAELVDKCNEVISFLDKNPNATTKHIKDKEKELNKVVKPVLEKISERENLIDLVKGIRDQVFDMDTGLVEDEDETKNLLAATQKDAADELEDLLNGPTRTSKSAKDEKARSEKLGNFLTDEEKKKIDAATKHVLDLVNSDPNLTVSDLKEQGRNVKQDTDNILKAAKTRSDFKDYLTGVRDQLRDEKDLAASNLSETDKKQIENAVNNALDWLNKEGASASSDAVDQKKKDVMNQIEPLLQKAKERGELETIANKLKHRLEDDVDLTSALTDKEKKTLENEVKEVLDFLAKNPNATTEQLMDRRKKFDENVLPILEKTEARNKLKNYANELRTRLYDEDDLGGKLSEQDKKKIENFIDEAVDFLETNPNATKEQIDQKRHALESKVAPILKKGDKARKAEELANDIKNRLENDSTLREALTPEERKIVSDATNDFLDWLGKNGATATENEIKDKERQYKEKVDPILNKAKNRNVLKEQAKKLRDKLNQDPQVSGLKFSDSEKKELEKHIQDAIDYLDTVGANTATTADQIKDKIQDFKNKTSPIVEKAKHRRALEKYATGVRDKIQNDQAISSRLTPEEKKLIDNTAKEVLDWIQRHGDEASLLDLKEKMREAKNKIEPAMQRAEKHKQLEEYVNKIRDKINGELKDCLTPEEKKIIEAETQKTLDWLSKNKTAPMSAVEAQQRALDGKISSIMEKAQTKKDLANFAHAIRDRLKNDKELDQLLTAEEKKMINDAVQETLDWLSKNPNASLADLKLRKKKLEDVVNNVLGDKEAAENFRNYAEKILEVLKKNKQVQRDLTDEEKRDVELFAETAKDWLHQNPNATARQIRMEKKRLEEKLGKIKKFKFEIPNVTYIGKFSEKLRWGDESKRTKDISALMGSYIKKGDTTTKTSKPVQPPTKQYKMVIPQRKLTKEEEEELKLFETMKHNKGGLIEAKLQSLMGSVNAGGHGAGLVEEDPNAEPAVVYPYAELKNNKQKKYPPGVDVNKREQYLSNAEFLQVFKMSREEFRKLPEFRQTKAKRDAELFAYAYEL